MAVTVRDILHLEKMNDALILAGSQKIDRPVGRIATIEKPYVDHIPYSDFVAVPGDLYLSKLYVFQNEKEKFYAEIEFMRRTESGGLITHQDCMELIDEHAIELANKYGIPILAINPNYGFAELTYQITDLVIRDKVAKVNEGYLSRILNSDLKDGEIAESLIQINSRLLDGVIAVYVEGEARVNYRMFPVGDCDVIVPLYGGVLCIMTFDAEKTEEGQLKSQQFLAKLKKSITQFKVGISSVQENLGLAKKAMLEAIYACVYCEIKEKQVCRYEELGEFTLLVNLKNKQLLRQYRDRVFVPIRIYEKEKGLDLMPVLRLYVKSGGEFKYIAEHLYIHETTVRYRIGKAQEILNIKEKFEFFADIRAAFYADKILEHIVLKRLS